MNEAVISIGVTPPVKILVLNDHPNTATTLRARARLGTHAQVVSRPAFTFLMTAHDTSELSEKLQ